MRAESIVKIGCLTAVVLAIAIGYGIWQGIRNFDTGPLAERYESMLEQHVVPHILDAWEPLQSTEADIVVDSITSRLLSTLEKPSYSYRFHLVNESQVNALTLPGGHIVIFSGLLCEADGPEQVAAVLAHELGHAEQKHVITRTLAETGISLTLAILMGQDARLGYEISRQIISSYFSREQEAEADTWGFQTLVNAGVHPKAHADFFRKVKNMREGADVPEWLSTHPNDDARITAADQYALPADFVTQPFDTISWNAMRNIICVKTGLQ
jgi:beta-barrel assembly-enhancing protease